MSHLECYTLKRSKQLVELSKYAYTKIEELISHDRQLEVVILLGVETTDHMITIFSVLGRTSWGSIVLEKKPYNIPSAFFSLTEVSSF